MCRSWWLTLTFLAFSTLEGVAQNVRVFDAETNEPLEFVTLYSENPSVFTTSNQQGEARIDIFEAADIIYLRFIGYSARQFTYNELLETPVIYLEPSKWSLDQVVISSTRWNRSEDRIPTRITPISPERTAMYNPQTAADMLGTSGEVFIQKSQQGGGSPMIRGFGANRLLYSVDGVRMNNAIFRSGNIQNVISLDPLALENTEVAFGPGAVMYGSDAIGAVMTFQTRQPNLSVADDITVSGNVLGRYASANFEKTLHADVEVGGRRWAGVTSLTFTDFDDLKMGSNGPDDYLRPWFVERQEGRDVQVKNPDQREQLPTGYSQWNFMQKLRFRPNAQLDVQYGFHYSRTSDYDRYDRLIQERNGLPRSAEWYYGPQKWIMNVLEVRHTAPKAFYDQAIFRIAHQFFEESRNDRNFQDAIFRNRIEKVSAFSVNGDFRKNYSKRTTLNYGTEWVINDVNSEGHGRNIDTNTSVEIAARYPLSIWNSIAAYALLEHNLNSKTDLQAGLRYNFFFLNADFSNNEDYFPLPESDEQLNNGGLAANVGIIHRTDAKGEYRIQLSTGFRSPNVDDVGKVFDSEPGAVVVPNPNLRPEYAYNAEVGLNQVLFRNLRIDITGYFTWLDNAMIRRDFTFNGADSIIYDGVLSQVQAIQNASESLIYGVQLGLAVQLPGDWLLDGRLNIQHGTDRTTDGVESPTRHASPMFGTARLSRSFRKWKILAYTDFSATRRFEDMPLEEIGKPHLYASDENGDPYAPGWYTLNIKGSFEVKKTIIFNLGIENITNQGYRTYSSGLASAGLNIITSVNITF